MRRVIVYGDYFWRFYNSQSLRVQDKIDWTLGLIAELRMVPEQYLKHLDGTDLYEIRMKTKKNKTVYFADHIEQKYGPRGTAKREKFERGYEAFKLGVILQQLRKKNNLTQEQLADRCGTTKNYISRIENDASDIRLSTLMKIINDGLGARLEISVHY